MFFINFLVAVIFFLMCQFHLEVTSELIVLCFTPSPSWGAPSQAFLYSTLVLCASQTQLFLIYCFLPSLSYSNRHTADNLLPQMLFLEKFFQSLLLKCISTRAEQLFEGNIFLHIYEPVHILQYSQILASVLINSCCHLIASGHRDLV